MLLVLFCKKENILNLMAALKMPKARNVMRLKRFYLTLLLALSLLAGCSQVVSLNDDEKDEFEKGYVDSDGDGVLDPEDDSSSSDVDSSSSSANISSLAESSSSASSSSSVASSDSAESSSSAISSSSTTSSSSVTSSSSIASSSSAKSSSSIKWSSSYDAPYVLTNSPWNIVEPPSSNKIQPEVSGYPYNAYVDMSWSFNNVDLQPSYYNSNAFYQYACMWMDKSSMEEVDFKTYYYTNLNKVLSSANFVTYTFYPNGSQKYQFSVDKLSGEDVPYLRVLGSGNDDEDALIQPVEISGRWYYTLDATELGITDRPVTVVRYKIYDDEFYIYGNRAMNVIISDEGWGGYTKNFNVNLIVAGKYMGTNDKVSVEELAERIHARLNLALNPGGIGVRKVNVLYAKDHPSVGSYFPETEEVLLYSDKSKRHVGIDSLSRWPGHEGEISIVLGYYVAGGSGGEVGGFSPMPGHVYNTLKSIECESNRDCQTGVTLATHVNQGETALSSRNITSAAIHELGHFFGLDHTSSWGNTPSFDNLSDTPECSNITADVSVLKSCPDYGNIMFPYSSYMYEYATFTPQQMDVIRAYISSTPHR